MTHETLKAKITAIINSENYNKKGFSRLGEALFDSCNTDNEPYHKIGYHLLRAYLNDSVDDALIAICGWSLETLMKKAQLLPDTENDFGDGKPCNLEE